MKFSDILEASLDELAAFVLTKSANSALERSYAEVILSFLRGDVGALKEKVENNQGLAQFPEFSSYALACRLRLAIRINKFSLSLIHQVSEDLNGPKHRWQGELSLLAATLLTKESDYQGAKIWFRRAYELLVGEGLARKALKARLNELVAESHIDSDRTLIAEYHDLYRWSIRKAQRDHAVAATCLLNISREYQRAGARVAALNWCAKGLRLAELQFGSRPHHLLLVQKADLLLEMDRRAEARLAFEEAKLSPFSEVQAAIEVLENTLEKVSTYVPSPDLLPTWKERVETQGEPPQLSKLEDQLVAYLSTGPKHRADILTHLYGENLSYEIKLNRFKSLLTTIRRKNAEIIQYKDGQYELTDRIAVPAPTRRALRGVNK